MYTRPKKAGLSQCVLWGLCVPSDIESSEGTIQSFYTPPVGVGWEDVRERRIKSSWSTNKHRRQTELSGKQICFSSLMLLSGIVISSKLRQFFRYQMFLLSAFWPTCVQLTVHIVDMVDRGHQGLPAIHRHTHGIYTVTSTGTVIEE